LTEDKEVRRLTNTKEGDGDKLGIFHRAFDSLYPFIRFTYERVLKQAWFSEISANLWVGGAPTYERDYEFILENGITAVVNIRAERDDDVEFYHRHGINYVRYKVPDIYIPEPQVITDAVDWVAGQVSEGRTVLIHCAKGRGRSAALMAGYLMRDQGLSYEAAEQLLDTKRPLTKLEDRHRRVLEAWIRTQER